MCAMKIHQIFFKNTLRNFCYLIAFSDGAIYCIDPFSSLEVLNALKGQKLKGIINTHDHCDHYSGNPDLITDSNCEVYAHLNANIPSITYGLSDNEIIYQTVEKTHDGDVEWQIKALYTPGHTMTHICLMLEKNKKAFALFTGDCFFNAGVGNCHNGGSPEVLYKTISEIFEMLPDDLLIYPGHEYLKRNLEFSLNREPSNSHAQKFLSEIKAVNLDEIFFINSMKVEREINPFLRLENDELRSQVHLAEVSSKKVFLTLRELRNKW